MHVWDKFMTATEQDKNSYGIFPKCISLQITGNNLRSNSYNDSMKFYIKNIMSYFIF